MNKPYLLFICLTLNKCNGPQAKQEKQCVENLKFQELGKFFSQKLFICFESQRKVFRGEEKSDRMKFFRQEAIRKKASKQKKPSERK